MLRKTKYLGISVAPQRNRRLLVLFTYAAFAVSIVVHAMRHPSAGFGDLSFDVLLCLLLTSRIAFGYLVPTYPFSYSAARVSSVPEVKSLMHPERNEKYRDEERDPEPPDERDIVIRNRAYYLAFNAILAYSILIWVVGSFVTDPKFSKHFNLGSLTQYGLLPILVMATTLPQAIILWSEPDVIDEPA
jgi:hypothetical protein